MVKIVGFLKNKLKQITFVIIDTDLEDKSKLIYLGHVTISSPLSTMRKYSAVTTSFQEVTPLHTHFLGVVVQDVENVMSLYFHTLLTMAS